MGRRNPDNEGNLLWLMKLAKRLAPCGDDGNSSPILDYTFSTPRPGNSEDRLPCFAIRRTAVMSKEL